MSIMSSSLEYLLSSFDEETQATPAASALAYPCYPNSPWIASGPAAQPLGTSAYSAVDMSALRHLREASTSLSAGYPTFSETEPATRVSTFGSSSLPSAPSGVVCSLQQPLYTTNLNGITSPTEASTSAGSTASPSVASATNPPVFSLSSPAPLMTRMTTLEAAAPTTPRVRSPISSFAYRPRSQQERFRTLFPHESDSHLETLGRVVLNGGFSTLPPLNYDQNIPTIDLNEGSLCADLLAARRLGLEASSPGGALASPLELTSPSAGSRSGDDSGETVADSSADLAPQQASTEPATVNAAANSNEEQDSKPSALKTSIRKKRSSQARAPEEPAPKKQKTDEGATCCICLEIPTAGDLASISGCSHPFCFVCIEKWADRENTCPLCKARFSKIERVNGKNCGKKVTDKNQRSNFGLLDDLDIFGGAGVSTTGTWPTHIAQLLFSGLGVTSVGRMSNSIRMGASMSSFSNSLLPDAPRLASVAGQAPPRVGFSTSSPSAYASSLGGASARATSTAAAASDVEPLDDFLDTVHRHGQRQPEQQQQMQRLSGSLEARSSVYSTTSMVGTTSTSSYPSLLSPFHHTTTSTTTTTTTTLESGSQWATNRAAAIMASSIPFGSINFHGQEEEEDILASTSPTSYVQRMQRDLDREAQLYQFSTTAPANNFAGTRRAPDASNSNRELGRSAETALEIDDSDNDDVEVVGIEAMM